MSAGVKKERILAKMPGPALGKRYTATGTGGSNARPVQWRISGQESCFPPGQGEKLLGWLWTESLTAATWDASRLSDMTQPGSRPALCSE